MFITAMATKLFLSFCALAVTLLPSRAPDLAQRPRQFLAVKTSMHEAEKSPHEK